MASGTRYYTFMVIPHGAGGRTLSVKVPAAAVYAVVGAAAFCVLVVGGSVLYSSILSRRLFSYHLAIAKNREQQQVIDTFSQKTDQVNEALTELTRSDNQLRRLLGLQSWTTKIKLASRIQDDSQPASLTNQLQSIDVKLAERKKSFEELKSWVAEVRTRFAGTPSRWPVYGGIMSRFGYRLIPWRGFHAGLDISSSYGAPIHATADGTVAFAGWRQGYGKTVIVHHPYSRSTWYAHCSGYAVKAGHKVAKGQVIAYIGTTGHSTGPHVHYEVRIADKPVNPGPYLNLNLLSASRLWRQ